MKIRNDHYSAGRFLRECLILYSLLFSVPILISILITGIADTGWCVAMGISAVVWLVLHWRSYYAWLASSAAIAVNAGVVGTYSWWYSLKTRYIEFQFVALHATLMLLFFSLTTLVIYRILVRKERAFEQPPERVHFGLK